MAIARQMLIAVVLSCGLAAQRAIPVPQPTPGSQQLDSTRVDGPLEVRAATADDEAVLAGVSYTRQRYRLPNALTPADFIATYRDALFAGGWKILSAPKLEAAAKPDGVISMAAHYANNGRNIFLRVSHAPDGTYEISAADVGEENWTAALAKDCRVPVPSLLFDRDRATLRIVESTPTLEKLANLLKAANAPPVEIQGHADNIGEAGAAERQALSEARARSVAAWLIAHGVPADKVTAAGYGKSKPIADNDTDLGRALNRRIEVACRKSGD